MGQMWIEQFSTLSPHAFNLYSSINGTICVPIPIIYYKILEYIPVFWYWKRREEAVFVNRIIYRAIKSVLFKGKAIILYGARQVGKTTLLKRLTQEYNDVLFLNCDEPNVRINLSNKTSSFLKDYVGGHRLVVLDEAQRVENIGLTIKLLVDNFPEIQIIVSSSSSCDLSNRLKEPLTGRKYEFYLYPFLSQNYYQYFLK